MPLLEGKVYKRASLTLCKTQKKQEDDSKKDNSRDIRRGNGYVDKK